MPRYTYPDEETMRRIHMSTLGAGAGMLGAAGTVASMNPLGGLLAIAGSAYPGRAEAPTGPIGPPLTNEEMWLLGGQQFKTDPQDWHPRFRIPSSERVRTWADLDAIPNLVRDSGLVKKKKKKKKR